VVGELSAAPVTLRRLLDQHGVRQVAPTRRQRAAAKATSGPRKQARAVRERCQARLAGVILTEPLRAVDGMVTARGPGLGMEWDEDAVRRYGPT
jgi:hypothetical protein